MVPSWLRASTLVAVLSIAVAVSGCNNDPTVVADRDPLADPLGDVAWADGAVYATNTDRGGHQGSQVDLFRFDDDDAVPDGIFDLGLNGYGYLAMASGPEDLYLQARDLGYVFRITDQGQHVWLRQDATLAGFWQARGLAYRDDTDRLVALYARGSGDLLARTYTPEFEPIAADDVTFRWDILDAATGPRAVTYHDGAFYTLGTDTLGVAIVVRADTAWNLQAIITDIAPEAVGITVNADGRLVIAHADRRLVPLR